MRTLAGGFAEQNAIIGDNTDRVAVDVGEARHQCGAIQRFEFIEFAAVHDAGDDFAHFERVARVGRNHAVDFFFRIGGGAGRQQSKLVAFDGV